MRKKILSLLLVFILLFTAGCGVLQDPGKAVEGELAVYYIDVGQADCELIIAGDHAMLIDGGNVDDGKDIVKFIKKLGISSLDAIVATHPHEDHIGGLSKVIDAFDVKKIYSPVEEYNGKCFEIFTKAANEECGLTLCSARDEWEIGEASVRVLWPFGTDGLDANNMSIVLRLTFGKTSFLFMGDLEKECETKLVNSGAKLSANVLKVGHHGSSTSTGYLFLRSVMPQFAVISCGKGNDYGHPHKETLEILEQANIKTFRTDELGTVEIKTDGENITVVSGDEVLTEKAESATPGLDALPSSEAYSGKYIGNKNSKKYHTAECESLPKEENRVYFETAEEAEAEGYTPCGSCVK